MARDGVAPLEVLLLAGGLGERLGLGEKAFVRLGGVTLLERAVDSLTMLGAPMIVAVPPRRVPEARAICPPGTDVIEGGTTRSGSLRLLVARSRAPMVLLHDVVHPLAPPELFRAVVDAAHDTGAASAALRPADLVYRDRDVKAVGRLGTVAERTDRAWIAQSPKAFRRGLLERGYALLDARRRDQPHALADPTWDDPGSLELVRIAGGRVVTVPGVILNFKITTPDDLMLAERLLGGSIGIPYVDA